VLDLIDQKIQIIDQRMAELLAFRTELSTLHSTWSEEDTSVRHRGASGCICPIIEQQTEVQDYPKAEALFEPAGHR